jgi:ankyrin repeat protein
MDAVNAGDLEEVTKLVKSGHKIDERDHGGWSPFIKACEKGHLEIAKLLLDAGANANDSSSFGWTPLMQASENGHLEVVKWLIQKGAKVETCENSDKQTALWKAVSHGNAAVCEYLVDHGANLKHVNHEKTPMIIEACYKGHLEVLKYLVSTGQDLKATVCANYGATPFLTSCMWGHPELVKYIASTVKDLDLQELNQYGQGALQLANRTPNLELVKLLFSLGYKVSDDPTKSPLIGASDLEILQYLLDTGLPVNVASEYGTSALADAAYNGRLEVVKLLISKGADPNLKNSDGQNALDYANMGKSYNQVDSVIQYLTPLIK